MGHIQIGTSLFARMTVMTSETYVTYMTYLTYMTTLNKPT